MAPGHITVAVTEGMPRLMVCNLYGYLCMQRKKRPTFRWDALVFKSLEETALAE